MPVPDTCAPVTTPDELTVTVEMVADTHGLVALGVPEPINVAVAFVQTLTADDGVMVGFALPVTVLVAMQLLLSV